MILFLGAFLCDTLAEPLRYRQVQQVQAKSLAHEASENQDSRNDEEKSEQGITEPPKAWIPIASFTNGQLVVLPVAVRENVDSTATVESTIINDSETTEESPITNGQVQEVETTEPKTKQLAAHKRPGPTIIIITGKKSGALNVEPQKQEANNESSETNEKTTEPAGEAVDFGKSNKENEQMIQSRQTAFLVQMPDGSFQQIVYFAPQTSQTQAAIVSQSANIPFQQFNQAPNYPVGFNPKIVTFSSQYNW